MTPEERRKATFEDFNGLLRDGVPVDEAIATAADDNELKREVFRAVAEKELGDLELHAARMAMQAAEVWRKGEFLNALAAYIETFQIHETDEAPPIDEWLEQRLNRSLTPSERQEALSRLVRVIRL